MPRALFLTVAPASWAVALKAAGRPQGEQHPGSLDARRSWRGNIRGGHPVSLPGNPSAKLCHPVLFINSTDLSRAGCRGRGPRPSLPALHPDSERAGPLPLALIHRAKSGQLASGQTLPAYFNTSEHFAADQPWGIFKRWPRPTSLSHSGRGLDSVHVPVRGAGGGGEWQEGFVDKHLMTFQDLRSYCALGPIAGTEAQGT